MSRLSALAIMSLALGAAPGCRSALDGMHGASPVPARAGAAQPRPEARDHPRAHVKLLGVYAVRGHPGVYLIEVTVDRPPGSLNMEEFTQEDPDLPPYD